MKLFTDRPRDHQAPQKRSEHPFAYVDSSARPEAAKVREFMESAFSNYPAGRQEELAARLRSDENYPSSSFELILHELLRLRRLPIDVEPPKAGTTKRPDFLVGCGDDSFYLEAALTTEESADRVKESKRLDVLIDLVNEMHADNFFVKFEVEDRGARQPSAKSITDYLTCKLGRLDPDDDSIWTGPDGFQSPVWVWEDNGWRIVFRPIPKKVEARGRSDRRTVGMIAEERRQVATAEALREAVRKKAAKYGVMDRPYVIAVNLIGWHLDEIDCIDALFGTFATFDLPGGGLRDVHERDGALRPDRNTRVSAVAFFDGVGTWNVATTEAFLLHNPFATRPLPPGRLGIPDAYYLGRDELDRRGGKPLGELLGLPPDWPA